MELIKPIIAFFIVQQTIMANNALKMFQENVGEELFEGDIHDTSNIEMNEEQVNLNDYHEHAPQKGLKEPVAWPNGIIPYTFIADQFSDNEKKFIMIMMKKIQDVSCIPFTAHDIETNYMEIRRESVNRPCHSFVGYRDTGAHELYLQNACMDRNGILHELMHAIGFYHEHNRYDRNDYVKIIFENIQKRYIRNFQKRPFKEQVLYGVDYDFSSVTHYPNDAFAINRTLPTIMPKYGKIIRVDGLSKLDIKKINLLYKCDKIIRNLSTCSRKCSRWNRCHSEIADKIYHSGYIVSDSYKFSTYRQTSTGIDSDWFSAYGIQVVRRVCGPTPQGCKCTCYFIPEMCYKQNQV